MISNTLKTSPQGPAFFKAYMKEPWTEPLGTLQTTNQTKKTKSVLSALVLGQRQTLQAKCNTKTLYEPAD